MVCLTFYHFVFIYLAIIYFRECLIVYEIYNNEVGNADLKKYEVAISIAPMKWGKNRILVCSIKPQDFPFMILQQGFYKSFTIFKNSATFWGQIIPMNEYSNNNLHSKYFLLLVPL